MLDGIHTCCWKPRGEVQAHVVLVHGYGEYSGRYGPFAARLADAGFHVHGFDHPGHGLSAGRRGYIACFDRLITLLAAQVESAAEVACDTPVFLFAHSMGGLVAVNYLAAGSARVSGAVISSPFLAMPPDVPVWKLRASGWLGRWMPWLPVGRVEAAAVSRDPDVVAAAQSDPLMYHGAITARTGAELLAGIQRAERSLAGVKVPLLLLHGTADRIAPFPGAERLYRETGSLDRTFHREEGGYHELLNDLDSEKVERIILDWLLERVTG